KKKNTWQFFSLVFLLSFCINFQAVEGHLMHSIYLLIFLLSIIFPFNNTINLVKFRHGVDPFIKYVQRTVFSTQNYSLLLRNMQHSDTGNYKEIISGLEDKIVAEYTVIVQDPVSPVNLIVTPSDPSYCNFTATCRIKDSQISGSFQCENKTCRLVDQTHLKVSSLNVYVKESSIICNHSNQVSWEKDVKNVSSFYIGILYVIYIYITCSTCNIYKMHQTK
uniref:Immunoglobulin V-set domain-containing protein n=1 Tax=Xiphophorus maculatus TaxID=8083 RepID=A0A3B5Q0K0_XIPMA